VGQPVERVTGQDFGQYIPSANHARATATFWPGR